jgi:hypothetical protein
MLAHYLDVVAAENVLVDPLRSSAGRDNSSELRGSLLLKSVLAPSCRLRGMGYTGFVTLSVNMLSACLFVGGEPRKIFIELV